MATAIVIDGAYFLRRFRWSFPHRDAGDPAEVARAVEWMTFWHLHHRLRPKLMDRALDHANFSPAEDAELYRIFFYDCPPLTKKMHLPISRRPIDLAKTPEAKFRFSVHDELQKIRKVALRLGRLNDDSEWRLRPAVTKKLITDGMPALSDTDFEIDTKQKGVDMKLGLDVAAMAFKQQVNQIILVAADGDFVPATKLARREGIDVVLDPMGGSPARDLVQHVDGIRHCKQEV
ncbi:NYN domain-containing protein [Sphingomonas donggukensis]|uniref:NYN domain-containing protein n=1 Tax=Sphingomonas donggukensis TaxID=2949093 RepID=A0ABY4TX13_9SPHN|nr:NYN domain-containing protein [Sphingomonas donggukensis]URW75694.1 NYN domain-containing protein [Sphingomonas donggukensis]